MSNREVLKKARATVAQNILKGERPTPDEMDLMSEPYKKVWYDHDNSPDEEFAMPIDSDGISDLLDEPTPGANEIATWADILDDNE